MNVSTKSSRSTGGPGSAAERRPQPRLGRPARSRAARPSTRVTGICSPYRAFSAGSSGCRAPRTPRPGRRTPGLDHLARPRRTGGSPACRYRVTRAVTAGPARGAACRAAGPWRPCRSPSAAARRPRRRSSGRLNRASRLGGVRRDVLGPQPGSRAGPRTYATTASPVCGCGTPITAASTTSGSSPIDVLDLARVDVEAGDDDQLLAPVDEEQVAARRRAYADVAGRPPAVRRPGRRGRRASSRRTGWRRGPRSRPGRPPRPRGRSRRPAGARCPAARPADRPRLHPGRGQGAGDDRARPRSGRSPGGPGRPAWVCTSSSIAGGSGAEPEASIRTPRERLDDAGAGPGDVHGGAPGTMVTPSASISSSVPPASNRSTSTPRGAGRSDHAEHGVEPVDVEQRQHQQHHVVAGHRRGSSGEALVDGWPAAPGG